MSHLRTGSRKHMEDGRAWTQEDGVWLRQKRRGQGQLKYGFSVGTGTINMHKGVRSLEHWLGTDRTSSVGRHLMLSLGTLCLVSCSVATVLKFLRISEQEASCHLLVSYWVEYSARCHRDKSYIIKP